MEPVPVVQPTPDQMVQLQQIAKLHRRVRRTAGIAVGSAATTLVIAFGTALFTAFSPDLTGIIASIVLLGIGIIEYIGARRLRAGDPRAATLLMRNQLLFLAMIALYCIVQLATFSVERMKNEALSPEVRAELAAAPQMAHEIDTDLEKWGTLTHYALYSSLLVVSIFFQGGLALYYGTRRKHVQAYRDATPPWAQHLLHKMTA